MLPSQEIDTLGEPEKLQSKARLYTPCISGLRADPDSQQNKTMYETHT